MANEKRLIDANALIAYFDEQCHIAANDTEKESVYVLAALKCCIDFFQTFPTVDAVEVVRCKDCKRYVDNREAFVTYCKRELKDLYVKPDDFCSYGERRTSDENL